MSDQLVRVRTLQAERDAAYAVLAAMGKGWDMLHFSCNNSDHADAYRLMGQLVLAENTKEALAKVQANTLREAAEALSDLLDCSGDARWKPRLLAEADRIEKEAGL